MLGILSKIYGSAVKRRNKRYDSSSNSLAHCAIPVISVGNLSVGGTGKTPFVEMLVRILKKRGHNPAIVGRGYKKKTKGEVIVSDGKQVLANADTSGDEMYLLANKLDVPVIAHEDKTQGALSAEKNFDIDLIILDDGFQHRQLFRDLDILLIDQETINHPELIPKGRLREPLENIKRADVICLMGDLQMDDKFIKNTRPEQLFIRTTGKPSKPYDILTGEILNFSKINELKESLVAVSGIAKPERFENMLNSLNYNIINHYVFPDHHDYKLKDLKKIKDEQAKNGYANIGTTEKDASKLIKYREFFEENNLKCFVFPFSLKITEGKKEFFNTIEKIFDTVKKY